MKLLKVKLVGAVLAVTVAVSATAVAAGPVQATAVGDYSRFQLGPGVYPAYPPCLAWVETNGGGCGGMVYFDCEGLFGPPAPCDDPAFWIEWS
jgi:hypothetical protein